ncbi:hypothetical protein BH09GEM1_BH09GEM1_14280 [soil metagenome]
MPDSPHIEPERLAALLDGRLADADAALVRAELAQADDDSIAAYADAVALITADASLPKVIPIASAQKPRRWITPSLAAAAVLVVAVLLARRPPSSGSHDVEGYRPSALAAALAPSAVAPDDPGWSATRGGGQGVSERGRSVRIGALLTDLEIAAARGTPTKSQSAAIAALLEDLTGGSFVASSLRQLDSAGSTESSATRRHEAGRQAIGMIDARYADIGAWIEASRVAAGLKDSTFAVQWPAEATFGALLRDNTLEQGTRFAVDRFLVLYKQVPVDFTARRAALDDLLRFLAR